MVAQTMAEKQFGLLLVLEAASHLPASSTRVGGIMNYSLIQIAINRTVRDASRRMAVKRIRHLAVTENNKIVSLLSVRDLVKMVSVREKPRFLHKT